MQFCLMELNTTNFGAEAQQFDDSSQYVYSSDGKQLSWATEATVVANWTNNQFHSYPTVHPGNNLDCVVGFDVPNGVTPAGL